MGAMTDAPTPRDVPSPMLDEWVRTGHWPPDPEPPGGWTPPRLVEAIRAEYAALTRREPLDDYGDSTPTKHRSDTLGPCLACKAREDGGYADMHRREPVDVERWYEAVSDSLAATTEGTDYAEAPEPSDEPKSPYVLRLTHELLSRLEPAEYARLEAADRGL